MPIGTKMATKTVKRKAKKEAKEAIGLDNDKKKEKKGRKKRGIL